MICTICEKSHLVVYFQIRKDLGDLTLANASRGRISIRIPAGLDLSLYDGEYICYDCAIYTYYQYVEQIPEEDLPLYVSQNWYFNDVIALYKQRLMRL